MQGLRNLRRWRSTPVCRPYAGTESTPAGYLIGYGPNMAELLLQATDDVVRIFQGAKAGELPFRGPTRFESAVNSRSARRLGVTLPAALLQSVVEVIE
jgi:putative ABC transport system substrate-binding protein